MLSKFPSFPACCQKVLQQLELENRNGARNCEKGHALNLEYARWVEAEAARKAAEAEAAQDKPAA